MVKTDISGKNITDDYDYVLDYIKESVEARTQLIDMVARNMLAYKGETLNNKYKQRILSYASSMQMNSKKRAEYIRLCDGIESKKSFVVFNAVEDIVSLAMGGASRFEAVPYDQFVVQDNEWLDKISSFLEHFYVTNQFESLIPRAIRNICLAGSAYLYIKHDDPDSEGQMSATMLSPTKMLNDPFRIKKNRVRYRGFQQLESWTKFRKKIQKKGNEYSLKVMNDVDQYLSSISSAITMGDKSPEYAGLMSDISLFYPTASSIYNQSENIAKGQEKKPAYVADDIEVSYLWDIKNKMYYEVVNRKYIITATKSPNKVSLDVSYYNTKGKKKESKFDIEVVCPIVEIPFIKIDTEPFPITPLFYTIDNFDDVCSIETVNYHNLSIMAPINFMGSSFDAEIITNILQIGGAYIEGMVGQTNVFSKQHDISPGIAAIRRAEDNIKKSLGVTEFSEVQQMIGDRASAAESGNAAGAVTQRLNSLLANIEVGISKVMDIAIKLYLINSDKDKDISFSYNGKYSSLSKADIGSKYSIKTKLKSTVKFEQARVERTITQLIGFLSGLPNTDQEQLYSILVPMLLNGNVTREQAAMLVKQEPKQYPVKDPNEKPGDRLNLDGVDPKSIIQQLSAMSGGVQPTGVPSGGLPPIPTQSYQSSNAASIAPGTSPDIAGQLANDTTGLL